MPIQMKKVMAVFLTVIALWFSCHSKRSKNILVKVLSGMFSLENVAPWKRRTNPVVGICRRYWLCNRRHGCERHAKKVGNFDFLCLLLVSCTSVQQEIVRSERKIIGLCYVYKLACTAVHGSGSCVKRVDRFRTKYRLASLKFRDPLEV